MKNWTCGIAALAVLMLAGSTTADDAQVTDRPTFYKDVLPILQQNCQNCHRPLGQNLGGMIAPMSLMTYQEVRPWTKAVIEQVSSRMMPPWHAAPEFHGVFRNERAMSEADVATVLRWASSGAVAGDPSDAPPPVTFKETFDGWTIGKPDLIVPMPEKYLVEDDVEDQYINFTVELTEEMLPESRWIEAIEFKPGSEAVHHIIAYAINKSDDPGRGDRGMIGGIAPGGDPDRFPPGYGLELAPGAKLVFAMHYHKESGPGTEVWDRSEMAFKFHETPVHHKVKIDAIGNTSFEIPAGHPDWEVGSARVFEKDTTILELMPHMHLRGKAARYVAYYPDGTEETLLHVPAYDFNWQTSYEFKTPKRIPAGTRIEVSMWFDNSPARAGQSGFNPERSIRFGGPTTDEMMLGWLTYTDEEVEPAPATRQVGQAAELASAR